MRFAGSVWQLLEKTAPGTGFNFGTSELSTSELDMYQEIQKVKVDKTVPVDRQKPRKKGR